MFDDPNLLLSFINTKLRDEYSSLDELCKALDLDKSDVVTKLEQISYKYDKILNKFV